MSHIALGTYSGRALQDDGSNLSYSVHIMERKQCWLDYLKVPPVKTAQKEQFHADAAYVIEGKEGSEVFKITIGGLPGQGRAGQVWDFELVRDVGIVTLKRDGVELLAQEDTLGDVAEVRKCAACGEEVHSQGVMNGGKLYHKECFVCSVCANPLAGTFTRSKTGEAICPNCVPKEVCAACGGQIKQKKMKVGESLFHPECFLCNGCENPIVGGFAKKGEFFLCKACVEGKVAPHAICPKVPDYAVEEKEKKNFVLPAVKKKVQTVRLGYYQGRKGDVIPERAGVTTTYSVRLMPEWRIWQDCIRKTKIDDNRWQAEGFYEEVRDGDGPCTKITFRVESLPAGAGPSIGSTRTIDVEFENGAACLIVEGMRLYNLNEEILDVEKDEYMQQTFMSAEEKQKLKDSPFLNKPKAKTEAPASSPETAPAKPAASVTAPAAPPAAAPVSATQGYYSLAQLQDPETWPTLPLDPKNRELHLSDEEFQTVFGTTKAEYEKLPNWQKDRKKKQHGLF